MDDLLITPTELAAELAGASGITPVLLDVRWTLAGADHAAHLAGHIPGALFVDLDTELAGPPGNGGRHPLPAAPDLQRLWRDLGLDDDDHVVVYDAKDSSVAARAWWLLRWSGFGSGAGSVRVLDGGFAGWVDAGRPTETGPVRRPGGGTAQARPGGLPTVDIDAAAAAADASDRVLLDARAAARYRGEVEPVDPVAGHIPGAVNLPLTDLVDDAGRFRPPPALLERFAAVGVTPAGVAAVASCGSGVTACHLVLAGALVDIELALFPASYSGWCAAGRSIATGPKVGTGR